MFITSKDEELIQIRNRHKLPTSTRFFLLEGHDLNFYHYGLLDSETKWGQARFRQSLDALGSLADAPSVRRDSRLQELIATRCRERRSSPNNEEYWLDWVSNLWFPGKLAERLRSSALSEIPDLVKDLATLLHVIPQSCEVGIMQRVAHNLFGKRRGVLFLDDSAPWTSIDSTLALLRPLEYFFEIGNPGARRANVHVLYGERGFLLGTILDFSCSPIADAVLQEIERTLEGLAVQELAAVLRTGSEEGFLQRLATNFHRALPVHSALHWTGVGSSTDLNFVYGLPWEQRSIDSRSVMASSQAVNLWHLPTEVVGWLRREVLRVATGHSEDDVARTPLGLGSASLKLPTWEFAGASPHPLDARLCVTFVSEHGDEALQLLLPQVADISDSASSVVHNVAAFTFAARLSTIEVSSAGRYPGGKVSLPRQWIYNPDSETKIIGVIEGLRRAWAGEQTAKPWPLLLLCGRPGTGKSELAQWLAKEVVGDPEPLTMDDLKDKHYSVTEENIHRKIKELCVAGPRALIIDEVEQFAHRPANEKTHDIVAAAFKKYLDLLIRHVGEKPRSQVLLVATTNYFSDLDPAIKSKFEAVEIRWSRGEFERLFGLVTQLAWHEEARNALFEAAHKFAYDPRESARIIRKAEQQASSDRRSPFRSTGLTVYKGHLDAVTGAQPNWEGGTVPANDGLLVANEECEGFKDLKQELSGILDWMRIEGITEDKSVYRRYHHLTKNILPWVKQWFPSWAHQYENLKRENKKRRLRRELGARP